MRPVCDWVIGRNVPVEDVTETESRRAVTYARCQ